MNKNRIKAQILKAIQKLPTGVELKRKELIDDGLGGQKLGNEITVGSYQGLLKKKNNAFKVNLSEKTSKSTKQYSIILVDVPCKKGDYFIARDKTMRILDIDDNGIYQDCELEVV